MAEPFAFLTVGFIIFLATRAVIEGIVLFFAAKFFGSKSSLLTAVLSAFLITIITMIAFELYVFPLLEVDPQNLQEAVESNLFGLILSYILPGIIWFFVVTIFMKVGLFSAAGIGFSLRLLDFAIVFFGGPALLSSLL